MSQPIITLSSLKFIKPTDLAPLLKPNPTTSTTAIIDVRDNDHLGGHIKSSQWIPINQLDARMPELLRVNADKERVVFHCMLSQQRGPKAALAYARARRKRERSLDGEGEEKGQEVCVLEGGFDAWRRVYGGDEGVTEGYVEELWEE